MAAVTVAEENRYQRAMADPEFRELCAREAHELASERRRVAEAAGYVYRRDR